jgi:hypothetical protein
LCNKEQGRKGGKAIAHNSIYMLYNIALIRCLEREMGYKIIIHNKNNLKKKYGLVRSVPCLFCPFVATTTAAELKLI